ncbi:MAG: glycosyltransferase family 1 protein [Pseudomonas sp.]|uniref:glycosyltransferase family 4 protein n=1 Tax=Pseudomonas sp. TaxID=306 RepID=UPI0030F318F8
MIYINARFLTQSITGVQRYSLEISLQLKKLLPDVRFVTPHNIVQHEAAAALGAEVIGSRTGHAWEQIDLPLFLKKNGSPLLVNLANTAPLFYRNKISTLHDIAFERFPENFSWKFRKAYQLATPWTIRTSLKVITVSEFSKREICEIYKTPPSKVVVVYNAVSELFQAQSKEAEEPYLLAVSSLNQQKNFHGLIGAFSLLKQNSHKLYIVGSLNKNFADPGLVKKIESDNRIKLLGRVSDEQLIDLYSGAAAFIYPSFYEGFGIPPLEAQACGCPVIVANAASLPEVCGDSALYCDPRDINDIADKIEQLISTPALAQSLTEKGRANVARFSWQASANGVLQVIREFQ